jgi:acyl-coenzyme A synthetase/AMP-(fatty) acid ligase
VLTERLRQRIDPVFLPRPLILVERLPRNATGKLPQNALQNLADLHLQANEST